METRARASGSTPRLPGVALVPEVLGNPRIYSVRGIGSHVNCSTFTGFPDNPDGGGLEPVQYVSANCASEQRHGEPTAESYGLSYQPAEGSYGAFGRCPFPGEPPASKPLARDVGAPLERSMQPLVHLLTHVATPRPIGHYGRRTPVEGAHTA